MKVIIKIKSKILLFLIMNWGLILAGCQSPTAGTSSPTTYTVTYMANGATGGTVPTDTNNYQQGATVTVLDNTGNLVKTGYTFAGWNTKGDGSGTQYATKATFSMGTSNVDLYSQWTNQTQVSITNPGAITSYTVSISGNSTPSIGTQTTYTSSYTGNPMAYYQWYLDGSAISGATLSSYSWTPNLSQFGQHVLTLIVTDTNGLSYSGSLTINVGN